MSKPLTGRKVFAIIATGFSIIIGVNLTLAYNAVKTFPGLETKNSYISSQTFDRDRKAQDALGWDVYATLEGDQLMLTINAEDGRPIRPVSLSGTFGRATNVSQDQKLAFEATPEGYVAPIIGGEGNWNLRMEAEAADGTFFRRRLVLRASAS